MPSGWCSARVSYTGVAAPGAVVCCACMHEAQSRRRQRVPSHTLPLTALVKSCAVTVRCITLSFELKALSGYTSPQITPSPLYARGEWTWRVGVLLATRQAREVQSCPGAGQYRTS